MGHVREVAKQNSSDSESVSTLDSEDKTALSGETLSLKLRESANKDSLIAKLSVPYIQSDQNSAQKCAVLDVKNDYSVTNIITNEIQKPLPLTSNFPLCTSSSGSSSKPISVLTNSRPLVTDARRYYPNSYGKIHTSTLSSHLNQSIEVKRDFSIPVAGKISTDVPLLGACIPESRVETTSNNDAEASVIERPLDRKPSNLENRKVPVVINDEHLATVQDSSLRSVEIKRPMSFMSECFGPKIASSQRGVNIRKSVPDCSSAYLQSISYLTGNQKTIIGDEERSSGDGATQKDELSTTKCNDVEFSDSMVDDDGCGHKFNNGHTDDDRGDVLHPTSPPGVAKFIHRDEKASSGTNCSEENSNSSVNGVALTDEHVPLRLKTSDSSANNFRFWTTLSAHAAQSWKRKSVTESSPVESGALDEKICVPHMVPSLAGVSRENYRSKRSSEEKIQPVENIDKKFCYVSRELDKDFKSKNKSLPRSILGFPKKSSTKSKFSWSSFKNPLKMKVGSNLTQTGSVESNVASDTPTSFESVFFDDTSSNEASSDSDFKASRGFAELNVDSLRSKVKTGVTATIRSLSRESPDMKPSAQAKSYIRHRPISSGFPNPADDSDSSAHYRNSVVLNVSNYGPFSASLVNVPKNYCAIENYDSCHANSETRNSHISLPVNRISSEIERGVQSTVTTSGEGLLTSELTSNAKNYNTAGNYVNVSSTKCSSSSLSEEPTLQEPSLAEGIESFMDSVFGSKNWSSNFSQEQLSAVSHCQNLNNTTLCERRETSQNSPADNNNNGKYLRAIPPVSAGFMASDSWAIKNYCGKSSDVAKNRVHCRTTTTNSVKTVSSCGHDSWNGASSSGSNFHGNGSNLPCKLKHPTTHVGDATHINGNSKNSETVAENVSLLNDSCSFENPRTNAASLHPFDSFNNSPPHDGTHQIAPRTSIHVYHNYDVERSRRRDIACPRFEGALQPRVKDIKSEQSVAQQPQANLHLIGNEHAGSLVPLEDGSRAMPPLPSLFDKHFTRLGTPPDTPRSVLALGSRVPTSAHKASPSSACCLKERCSDADESRRRASLVHRRCLSDHPRRNSQHSRESSVERTSCAQSSSDAWGSRRRYDDISDDILVAGDSCCRHFATKSSSHDRPQVGALRHSYHEDLSTRSLDRRRSGFRESLSWGWTRDVPCCGYHHGLLPTDIKDSNYHLPVIGGDQGRCSASQQDDLDASGCCYGDSRLQVERLYDLEANKSSLELQVSVLQEQVEAQAEKISELEALLRDKNRQLLLTEERLQKEVMAVSGLETQRLQLLSELSCLQLEQAAAAQGSSARSPLIQLSPSLAGFVTPSALNGPSSSPAPGRLQDSVRSFGPPRTPPPNFGREADAGAAVLRVARCGSASTASKPTTLPHLHASGAGGKYSAMTAGVAEATTRTSRFASERTSSVDGAGDDTSGTSPGTCDASKPGGVGLAPFGAPGKRCASAPNLAETEKQSQSCHQSPNIAQRLVNGQHTAEERQTYGPADGCLASPGSPADGGGMRKSPPSIKTLSSGNLHNIQSLEQYCDNQQQSSPITSHKPNTIKKIFTRLRRSSSGRQSPPGTRTQDLRRGGVRATATARLGGTAPRPVAGAWQEPSGSLETWSSADCVEWMTALGLSQYTTALRCWLGDPSNHLSRATSSQLDKQLGVRHPLHRKKLQLAIASRMGSYPSLAATSPSERIEGSTASASWISQWLDDVGLPQYKDAFHEACVDPRVLNVLTWEDLAFLKVTSLLHAVSIKRGIQVLREHNFDSSVLLRRSNSSPTFNDSANNNINNNSGSNGVAQEVERWTNHRVMEWLKTVDLSEYAPNLRGSGVHGALLVYEVRFNAEVLAALLSIPASKTLLRRHLNTHFKELVGRDVVHEKREVENAPGFSPLTTATKVKPSKRSQFSLKRRSSSSSRNGGKGRPALEFDDLLCPLEERRPRAALSAASQLANSPETR
ncbi:uncharacterized protein LOC108677154 isoform X2 [Hyalella azteca]|uniref:Uncharacterized protein LOC108677154 isoform X2 n=1 Tax=Hyalella azteca TaxID=294128 RepID=A0A979FTW5_HYAAZ|nr:uncharacterized protein LOC108677154 isoform X2 [Hyalella azteca]